MYQLYVVELNRWCFLYRCKTKDYRANVSFALAAYLIDRNCIVGTWVQVLILELMVTDGPSDVTSTGISFPVVSFREIFAEFESMSWSKVAVSLSDFGWYIYRTICRRRTNCMGWQLYRWCFRYRCKTKDYRANVSFALAAYLIDRNRIVGTWVQV